MKTFIKFDDKIVELVKDELAVEGDWYELESHYNLERKLAELDHKKEKICYKINSISKS